MLIKCWLNDVALWTCASNMKYTTLILYLKPLDAYTAWIVWQGRVGAHVNGYKLMCPVKCFLIFGILFRVRLQLSFDMDELTDALLGLRNDELPAHPRWSVARCNGLYCLWGVVIFFFIHPPIFGRPPIMVMMMASMFNIATTTVLIILRV